MEVYLGKVYTSIVFGNAAPSVPSFIGSKVIFLVEILCALCRPHFLTDFFQNFHRCASQSNLHTYSFWWCCPQCSIFYRVLLFRGKGGGGEVCPSFEQKDDAKIAASAGGYIRIARQWRFLVVSWLWKTLWKSSITLRCTGITFAVSRLRRGGCDALFWKRAGWFLNR